MNTPTFNAESGKWEFVMFGRTEAYDTKEQAGGAVNRHMDWMFSDTDYSTYEEN